MKKLAILGLLTIVLNSQAAIRFEQGSLRGKAVDKTNKQKVLSGSIYLCYDNDPDYEKSLMFGILSSLKGVSKVQTFAYRDTLAFSYVDTKCQGTTNYLKKECWVQDKMGKCDIPELKPLDKNVKFYYDGDTEVMNGQEYKLVDEDVCFDGKINQAKAIVEKAAHEFVNVRISNVRISGDDVKFEYFNDKALDDGQTEEEATSTKTIVRCD